MVSLITKIPDASAVGAEVIHWACPVPAFGNISTSAVATIGLNPSNREFVDASGLELVGLLRRFPTLASLGIDSWLEAEASHLKAIFRSCDRYFSLNPYDAWFGRLDRVISGLNASYYGTNPRACHLDLIPYATSKKWMELDKKQRLSLLGTVGDSLAEILLGTDVRVLVLNGQAVVDHFKLICPKPLERVCIPDATLARRSGVGVKAYGYRGKISTLAGVPLDRELLVLGYNHNLQSSYGVTREAMAAVREWLTENASEVGG